MIGKQLHVWKVLNYDFGIDCRMVLCHVFGMFGTMFVVCFVVSIGRILSLVDKGSSGMVSAQKLACTGAVKQLSGTPGSGSHAVACLGASSGTPGHGSHVVAWLGASSGTL